MYVSEIVLSPIYWHLANIALCPFYLMAILHCFDYKLKLLIANKKGEKRIVMIHNDLQALPHS